MRLRWRWRPRHTRVTATASLPAGSRPAARCARPIIGILTLPNDVDTTLGHSYFPASYVKFLEGGGARVVPIPYDQPLATTQAMLKNLNGALFTGGSASFHNKNGSLTVFSKTANAIFEESVRAAAAGEAWPLWGTCLGFELISFLAANYSETVLTSGWDSENITLPVKWDDAAATSRLFGGVPELRDIFASKAVALNAHQQGVSRASFAAEPTLAGRFDILGTSVDRKGKEFIAAIEAKPPLNVFGTQFHPEKIMYEWWASEAMDHEWDSIRANRCAGGDAGARDCATTVRSCPPVRSLTHTCTSTAPHPPTHRVQLHRVLLCEPNPPKRPQVRDGDRGGGGPHLQLPHHVLGATCPGLRAVLLFPGERVRRGMPWLSCDCESVSPRIEALHALDIGRSLARALSGCCPAAAAVDASLGGQPPQGKPLRRQGLQGRAQEGALANDELGVPEPEPASEAGSQPAPPSSPPSPPTAKRAAC